MSGHGAVLSVHHTALHDELHLLELRRVGPRIARRGHKIGKMPRQDCPNAVLGAKQHRRTSGGGDQRIARRHAVGDQQAELHGVIALADIGAVGDLDAGPDRQRQILLGQQVVSDFLLCRARPEQFRVLRATA